ncbi:polysaccharide deacetylase family protein [Jiella marina]|uniref:polysaccharide deacetylase family protein n=1 Tax=Jiella sp. LLJ827 TaxID=2917712 RepID=UPI002100C7F4|nr:polysaccharide deacetylase family protein [Jiella sp. LLJ827]MCQ0990244.1 polysaccharide deacetylase family protein [Jiella sp. LLJ827]
MAADFPLTVAALDRLAGEDRAVALWWRDDDARRPSVALDRLLLLREKQDLQLALAVIPEDAEPGLAARLDHNGMIAALLHGWSHANHAPADEKRAEFGDHRPNAAMERELIEGRARLVDLFGERFLPVFVPPWNRIGERARTLLPTLGLPIVSTYGPARPPVLGGPAELNTHLDIMDWRAKSGLAMDEADRRLSDLIETRRGGSVEPIGILSHHLQHDEAAWALLERLLAEMARHPAVLWPDMAALMAARNTQ